MKLLIVCFFLILLTSSCNDKNEGEKKLSTLVHKNGISIQIDESIATAKETKAGFTLNLAISGSRYINEINIKLLDKKPSTVSMFTEKTVDNDKYYFSLKSFSEGSGGTEYDLKIWKPIKSGGILLEHYVQQNTKPDFEKTWTLISTVSVD